MTTKSNLFSVGRLALFPLILACTGEDDAPPPADVAEVECVIDLDCNRLGPGSDCPGCSLESDDEGYRYCDLGVPEIEVDNRCVTCLAAESRSELIFDVGCEPGQECIENRCIAVTCEAASECPPDRPYCVGGDCLECSQASDCPFHGTDDCINVSCAAGACVSENVCACDENADCADGNECTQDVCDVASECRHFPIQDCPAPAAPPPAGGGGGEGTPPPAETGSITANWSPASGTFSAATLSASIAGAPMVPRCTQANATVISCTLPAVTRGATVDVSVEFTQGGQTSFSCVMSGGAMTPVGTISAAATTGTPPAFTQVPNGLGGCNRRTTMP